MGRVKTKVTLIRATEDSEELIASAARLCYAQDAEKAEDGEVYAGEDGDAGDQDDGTDLSDKISDGDSGSAADEHDTAPDPSIESTPDDAVSRFSGLSTIPSDQENKLLGNWGDE